MADETIPSDVADFIRERIPSVSILESLVYLQARPDAWMSAREVSEGLRTSAHAERQNLETLASNGLVKSRTSGEAVYQYAPASSDLRRVAERTADSYRQRRVAVIELIYAPRPQRSHDAAAAFADAFNLKRRK